MRWAKELQRANIDFQAEDDATLKELEDEYKSEVQGRFNLVYHQMKDENFEEISFVMGKLIRVTKDHNSMTIKLASLNSYYGHLDKFNRKSPNVTFFFFLIIFNL